MIAGFGDKQTEDLFHGRRTGRTRRYPPEITRIALSKLDSLNAAASVLDLRSPPGNRLEALKGDLQGFHSIRVNQQCRIIFRWESSDAHEVRLIDYHS